jgi:glycine cleavage system aminomethyltransferase T
VRLLSRLGVNTFKNFGRNKATQFVACSHEGYVIGDAILFGMEDDKVQLVGRPPISTWVHFNAVTGGYNFKVDKDERSLANSRRWISLSMVNPEECPDGTEVTVIAGEPDDGTRKPVVERHVQKEIRAIVGPCPFAEGSREHYRPYALSP